jgi:hypothetical protein
MASVITDNQRLVLESLGNGESIAVALGKIPSGSRTRTRKNLEAMGFVSGAGIITEQGVSLLRSTHNQEVAMSQSLPEAQEVTTEGVAEAGVDVQVDALPPTVVQPEEQVEVADQVQQEQPVDEVAARRAGRAAKSAEEIAAEASVAEKACVTCGETKPITKFPTVNLKNGKGRGEECRTCRDAAREARKAQQPATTEDAPAAAEQTEEQPQA